MDRQRYRNAVNATRAPHDPERQGFECRHGLCFCDTSCPGSSANTYAFDLVYSVGHNTARQITMFASDQAQAKRYLKFIEPSSSNVVSSEGYPYHLEKLNRGEVERMIDLYASAPLYACDADKALARKGWVLIEDGQASPSGLAYGLTEIGAEARCVLYGEGGRVRDSWRTPTWQEETYGLKSR